MVIGRPNHGFLVLADISGFTAFVTTTELEHGPPIIAALLEEVIQRISPPLEIQELEGDAVFALGLDGTLVPPATLLEVLNAGFAGFRSRQRELQADESCSCNACRSVWRLRLKMICHHGAFLRQAVGDRVQAAGSDVILAHRLLKNRLARKNADYTLFTRPALRSLDVDPVRAGLSAHVERDEHFGDVECFIVDPARVTASAA
jgi:hypothetical protein